MVNLGNSPHTIQENYGANEACTWTIVGQPGTGIEAQVSVHEKKRIGDMGLLLVLIPLNKQAVTTAGVTLDPRQHRCHLVVYRFLTWCSTLVKRNNSDSPSGVLILVSRISGLEPIYIQGQRCVCDVAATSLSNGSQSDSPVTSQWCHSH